MDLHLLHKLATIGTLIVFIFYSNYGCHNCGQYTEDGIVYANMTHVMDVLLPLLFSF